MGPSGKLKPVSTLLMLHLNSQVLGTKGSVCPAPWLWRRWLRRWLVQKEALALSHCRTDGECCLLRAPGDSQGVCPPALQLLPASSGDNPMPGPPMRCEKPQPATSLLLGCKVEQDKVEQDMGTLGLTVDLTTALLLIAGAS